MLKCPNVDVGSSDAHQMAMYVQYTPIPVSIQCPYGYPNGFEDLTHGQARFLSIKSNADEVLNQFKAPSYSYGRR